MKNRVLTLALAAAALLGLAACSPATGFKNQEQRWTANQSTQPVAYTSPAPSGEKQPAQGTFENTPTSAKIATSNEHAASKAGTH